MSQLSAMLVLCILRPFQIYFLWVNLSDALGSHWLYTGSCTHDSQLFGLIYQAYVPLSYNICGICGDLWKGNMLLVNNNTGSQRFMITKKGRNKKPIYVSHITAPILIWRIPTSSCAYNAYVVHINAHWWNNGINM